MPAKRKQNNKNNKQSDIQTDIQTDIINQIIQPDIQPSIDVDSNSIVSNVTESKHRTFDNFFTKQFDSTNTIHFDNEINKINDANKNDNTQINDKNINSKTIYTTSELKSKIERLSENEMCEIFKIIKNNGEKYSTNNNGIFVNISMIKKATSLEICKFLYFCDNNNKIIDNEEKDREKYRGLISDN
jgi:hypothetical protein